MGSNGDGAVLTNDLYHGARGLQDLRVVAQFNWQAHVGGASGGSITYTIGG